ncbi:protein SWEETIE-like [Magnolia sinica]|uniref:protein SWEETIE-like n=1 Tax=Magnolia sinica TaxID=86752 RepID=UPI00265B6521|nr:protein SWEETIE-like [Magnolia sinica]
MAKKVERESVPLSRFGVLVAQLESIVASAPQQPPDALLCFDLLSDLVSVIDDEPKASTSLNSLSFSSFRSNPHLQSQPSVHFLLPVTDLIS